MMHPLRKAAMALPLSPGVYLMKNAEGKIIYIGKAKALKNRVSQYFGADTGHSEKTKRMVAQVEKFDTIVTDSEFEALVLECSLIKQYSPKYNILLKDDKGYHYIRVSPPPYARIEACKQLADDGARYLGPYVSSFTVRESVEEAQKIFQLPTCQQPLAFGKARGRSCLNHAIHQCCAPCTGRVPEEEYAERVAQAVTFLTQGSAAIHEKLTEQMEAAAERLDFEKAARLRDRVHAIDRLAQRQKVVMSRVREQDVVAAVQSGDTLCFEVFRFTGGNLTDQEHFFAEAGDTLEGARAAFVQQYYAMRERVPPLVALDGACEDTPLLEQFLSEKAGRHVHITVPQKGEQARLTALCRQNAAEKLAQKLGLSGRDAAA
ncbi:MAG: excinuclease ABC subunit UvrC, partial [Oscillospiraceae bacterium]|nr:excinuclease ABC subunit UvrC [Oscillospiraceae bacterium]